MKKSPKRVVKKSVKKSPKRVVNKSPKRVMKKSPPRQTYMDDKIINTEKIKEIAKKSMSDVEGYLKTTGEKAKDISKNVFEKAKDISGNVVEKVKDLSGNVVEKVKDLSEKLSEIDSEDEKANVVSEKGVKKENWQLYTMDGCDWCVKAKELLEARCKEDPENRKLDVQKGYENTDPEVIAMLAKYGTGWPKIFFNEKFIGGYSNLEETFEKINNGSI